MFLAVQPPGFVSSGILVCLLRLGTRDVADTCLVEVWTRDSSIALLPGHSPPSACPSVVLPTGSVVQGALSLVPPSVSVRARAICNYLVPIC